MALKAHVGFEIQGTKDVGPRVINQFSQLGYRAIEETPNKWIFKRGNKLLSLWRFDIRAYYTTLTVRTSSQENGRIWIACDWDVWTCMAITTGGDVGTLEAEGRELESILRGTG
jgi:hypothetical protein